MSRGNHPCRGRNSSLNLLHAAIHSDIGNTPDDEPFGLGLSDLQGQFHEKGRCGRAGDGFRPAELRGVGVWLERDFHAGRTGLGGGRAGLAGREKRELSFPGQSFLKRACGALS